MSVACNKDVLKLYKKLSRKELYRLKADYSAVLAFLRSHVDAVDAVMVRPYLLSFIGTFEEFVVAIDKVLSRRWGEKGQKQK